jgi:hypothetical protein
MFWVLPLVVIGAAGVGLAALLVKLLSPSAGVALWQAVGVVLLWLVWVWLLRLPQTADGWTMHALEGSYWGVLLIAVFVLLIPVLLVTSVRHARYFLLRLRR